VGSEVTTHVTVHAETSATSGEDADIWFFTGMGGNVYLDTAWSIKALPAIWTIIFGIGGW